MNRKSRIITVSVFFCAIVSALFFYFCYLEENRIESKGEELILAIEKYKNETGRLPGSVIDLGIQEEMGQGPYYKKMDSLVYIVYFNIGFDEIRVYCSNTEEWKDRISLTQAQCH